MYSDTFRWQSFCESLHIQQFTQVVPAKSVKSAAVTPFEYLSVSWLSFWRVLSSTIAVSQFSCGLYSNLILLYPWLQDSPFDYGMYPRSFQKGAREGVWWSCMTMTTVGWVLRSLSHWPSLCQCRVSHECILFSSYGDLTANSIPGRLFAICWIMIGILLYSMLLSNITTALTVVVFEEEISLYGTTVSSEMYLRRTVVCRM